MEWCQAKTWLGKLKGIKTSTEILCESKRGLSAMEAQKHVVLLQAAHPDNIAAYLETPGTSILTARVRRGPPCAGILL